MLPLILGIPFLIFLSLSLFFKILFIFKALSLVSHFYNMFKTTQSCGDPRNGGLFGFPLVGEGLAFMTFPEFQRVGLNNC